jgi:hypothetical protein
MYLLACYKQTKSTCHRTRKRVSNINMMQTLHFEILSSGKHYSVTEILRTKYRFIYNNTYKYNSSVHLNEYNNTFKSYSMRYLLKRWHMFLLHLRKYETGMKLKKHFVHVNNWDLVSRLCFEKAKHASNSSYIFTAVLTVTDSFKRVVMEITELNLLVKVYFISYDTTVYCFANLVSQRKYLIDSSSEPKRNDTESVEIHKHESFQSTYIVDASL